MTESEWLTSNDPAAMLAWLTMDSTQQVGEYAGRRWAASIEARVLGMPEPKQTPLIWPNASDRKLRLFALACADAKETQSSGVATGTGDWAKWAELTPETQGGTMSAADGALYWAGVKVGQHHIHRLTAEGKTHGANLLREIFGNPWRQSDLVILVDDPLAYQKAMQIAKGIYTDRNFEAMPILADALEDAGCDDEEVLSHCRGKAKRLTQQEAESLEPGTLVSVIWSGGNDSHVYESGRDQHDIVWLQSPGRPETNYRHSLGYVGEKPLTEIWTIAESHVRGCYVLDLILGKS